jgi:hypothetical protein
MKKYLHQLSKIKTPYLILGLLTLIFSITISFLLYYQTKPSFSPLPPQNGVFQDPDTIDTTIKSISFNKYQYQNSNQVHQTSFRNDPTDSAAIQFANKYADLSFFTNSTQSFAEANPEVEPTIDGSTITYPAIFPHTDLRYTVEPSRLLEEFIVHDRETALSMTEITQTLDRSNIDSYKEVDGSIELYKDQVLIATVPKPVMYESGDQESRSYDLAYTIKEINNNTLSITKVINETGIAWLSDPDRQYPIVIDLVIDNADTAASWVSSDTTNTVVTQETTIKQEGTGSVKVATTAEVSTTLDLMEYAYDHVAQTPASNNISATGGTITYSGGYTIHTFTSSGTFTVNSGSGNVEYLVVGGGGGGGRHSGAGGGGGGFRTATDYAVTAQGYTVTVGAGGASLYGTYPTQGGGLGLNGANSVFDTITALGGGGGGWASAIGNVGGSGGGSARALGVGAAGTAGQGNAGGTSSISGTPYPAAGGGGAGAIGGSPTTSAGGAGGSGLASSISGSSVTYAGGGGGNVQDTYPSGGGAGGSGGGGAGAGSDSNYGYDGTANTGGGGGGAHYNAPAAGTDTRSSRGGSGVVIARYPTTPVLQSYSEASIKTQGSYSLKGVASTNAASKTLTRTISSPLNLAGHDTINFDIRSSRTGSNIKIGIHDTGGTTTEITPNITSANTFQAKSWDISGVSNANKDAIDKIIITIVNASSANTFYIDDMTATGRSLNDTVTLTKSSTDLSGQDNITYWVRSNSTGSFARFEFGESASSEQTDAFTINSANTWEQKTWDITGISAASRNAVTKFAFKLTSDTNGAILYFDDIQTTLNNVAPNTPSLDLPTDTATNQSLLPVLKTTATDDDSDYLRYKIELCEDVGMSVSCQTFDQTSSQTGWSGQNTQTSTAYTSGTQATYTLQTPLAVNDTFYWRSYAIDPAGTNTWSSTQTPYSFTTTTAPTAPTTPYTEGATNPTGVGDLTPEFSAVHNDADGDSASYYQIEVNTASNFAGTSMWDSTKTSMTTTANGVRSPDISYAGTSLALDGSGYYWRIKFWDTLGAEGVVSATQNFGMNVKPTTPSLELPTNTDTNQSLLPVLKTTTTDADSDYLRYKIELCEDVGMSVSCQTFDQTSSQTGWSGQDAQTSTAYVSGTQATYTLQSALAANDTFYWRSYAIDPAGTNTWSSTQTPYSFSTTSAPTAPTTPYTEGTTNPTGVIDLTPEFSAVHNDGDGDSANYYQIIVNTQVGFDGTEMWDSGKTSMTTTANGVRSPDISYAGTSLALDDTTYYWHVKFWNTLGAEGTYSATANFGMNILPNTPSLDLPTDTATNQSVLPILKTTGTDTDSDYLRYKIQICTDLAMTTGCNTYDQTSSQTGWTGQNTQTSTAYTSGAQATYTLQSALNTSSTYYWRSYAIDPGGANTWSATQTPYSFTTSIRTRILGPARGYSGVRIK